MLDLIELNRILGGGLSKDSCSISLQEVEGEGQFWAYRSDAKSGIWCSHSDWQAGASALLAIDSVKDLPDDLTPSLAAALFSVISAPFVRDLSVNGEPCSLISGIYPVVQCEHYRFVLVGFSASWLKLLTANWSPYQALPVLVKVPLIAGYISQDTMIDQGHGVWLKDGVDPDKGSAILWWEKPLAQIRFMSEQQWQVNKVYPAHTLSKPASVVQIGVLELELTTLLALTEESVIEGALECELEAQWISNGKCLHKGELLVSDDGVLFRRS
ncbi:hypothetical protein ACODM8_01925 [Vibrio ostreicida]|uniref:Uncharacterized protein n=1 Tax=Vibrio ostreicida TaxID=526588 RepID=A0ABT8BSB5_9VIBR|nr:hypothetical protein [Vibrio ostreicida]MDN3610031.1 hypothetical protein [Vibrio ostreicida]NPD10456.1 hypothetical protein [Vibrio ostreicida]